MKRIISALTGAVALTATTFAPPAQASGAAPAATCSVRLGYVTADGGQGGSTGYYTRNVFPPGSVRLSTTFDFAQHSTGAEVEGWVVQGDALFWRHYWVNPDHEIDPGMPNESSRIGGGWTNFTALEVSQYSDGSTGKPSRTIAYGLRQDGTLFRWNVVSPWSWRRTGAAAGFAAVKSMTLISKTRTYDTFLANTRSGVLYTVRIPITAPMNPIVRPVRTRTWQGFEQLVADKCGQYGTILLGLDKDTKTAYRYAVGHANGTATVINSLGRVDGSFQSPVYFRWARPWPDPLNGD